VVALTPASTGAGSAPSVSFEKDDDVAASLLEAQHVGGQLMGFRPKVSRQLPSKLSMMVLE
jgi:hypothetical protein